MDDHITFDDFFFKFLNFFLIHWLDLVVSFKIRFLEVFELSLKLLELSVNSFIVSRQCFVKIFKFLIFFLVLFSKIQITII